MSGASCHSKCRYTPMSVDHRTSMTTTFQSCHTDAKHEQSGDIPVLNLFISKVLSLWFRSHSILSKTPSIILITMLSLDMCLYKLENIYCSRESKKNMLIYNIRVVFFLCLFRFGTAELCFHHVLLIAHLVSGECAGNVTFLCSCGILETCLEWGTTGDPFSLLHPDWADNWCQNEHEEEHTCLSQQSWAIYILLGIVLGILVKFVNYYKC